MSQTKPYCKATTFQVIQYWRNSLAQADLLGQENITLEEEELVEIQSLANGYLSQHLTTRLFKKSQTEQEEDELPPASYVSLVVAPVVAQRRYSHSQQPAHRSVRAIAPIWIQARLTSSGELLPENDNPYPWLCRSLLDPSDSDVVVGTLESLDRYLSQTILSADEQGNLTWDQVLAYSKQMLETVSQGQWQLAFSESRFSLLEQGIVRAKQVLRGVSRNILKVYDHLLRQGSHPTLITTFASLTKHQVASTHPAKNWVSQSIHHLSHVSSKYPLSPSQREAISHVLGLNDGEILAVNGPPGTGKTTLLHDIITSHWVKAALNGNRPPIMVVASTNNQAVTNVLDSFNNVSSVSRWLPDINSYGLYLCGTKRKSQAISKGYHWITRASRHDPGFVAQVENFRYFQKAQAYFLECCQSQLHPGVTTLEQALVFLSQQLKSTQKLLAESIDTAQFCFSINEQITQKYQNLGGMESYLQYLSNRIAQAQRNLAYTNEARQKWRNHLKKEPWWMNWFAFIPFVNKRRTSRRTAFVQQYPDLFEQDKEIAHIDEIEQLFNSRSTQTKQRSEQLYSDWDLVKGDREKLSAAKTQWETLSSRLGKEDLDLSKLLIWETNENPEDANLLNWLDRYLRFRLFELATHYWEARWLIEVRQLDFIKRERQSPSEKRQTWERYAMLTPCFVSTMHSGPKFFDCFESGVARPHYEGIDCLVVDEAGQVAPEVAGAMFALAKTSLAVGDIKQIEPVWNIPAALDYLNARTQQLVTTDTISQK